MKRSLLLPAALALMAGCSGGQKLQSLGFLELEEPLTCGTNAEYLFLDESKSEELPPDQHAQGNAGYADLSSSADDGAQVDGTHARHVQLPAPDLAAYADIEDPAEAAPSGMSPATPEDQVRQTNPSYAALEPETRSRTGNGCRG